MAKLWYLWMPELRRFRREYADRKRMKRELATLPYDLPHPHQGPTDGACLLCNRQNGADLHQELVIEKAQSAPRLVRERGV